MAMAVVDAENNQKCTSDETVVREMNEKLLEWQACKTAKEYFDIPYRSPFKKQIQDPVLNRFGGGMGPYADCLMEDIPGVRYINATEYPSGYLPGDTKEFNYIATMCPKLETFEHFWLMAWAKNTKIVVNLTNANDRVGSRPSDKKERYWPPYRPGTNIVEQSKYWNIKVSTVHEEEAKDFKGLWKSIIHLCKGNEERYVTIYSYIYWVDFGRAKEINRPGFRQNARNIVRLILEVEKDAANCLLNDKKIKDDSYIIVHCSAGVGRTGTYMTLARILHEYEGLKSSDQHVSFCDRLQTFIFQVIQHLRFKRLWMVKTEFEYATIFASLCSFADRSGIQPVTWPSGGSSSFASSSSSNNNNTRNNNNMSSMDDNNDNTNNDEDIAQYDFQNDLN